jgi:DNA-binding LacI/PurR family transcriptional regulator
VSATLKDVALKAGVSIKTVSNVVNGYTHVTPAMRKRVQAAIDELNYQPNLPARYLRKGRSGVIAYALPDLSNSYFSDIGDVIIRAAAAHGYTVLIDHTQGMRQNESLIVNGLRPRLIDGVILSSLALQPEDVQPQATGVPLVLLGEHFLDVPHDYIAIDNVAAARLATEHLISLGKQRIAAIGAQEALPFETGHLRIQGYLEGLKAAGRPVYPELIKQVPAYTRSCGADAMRDLLTLDEPPDAVFCFNDLMALGALRVLQEAGVRVPEDLALIGFDDIEECRFSTPSLSTIAPDKEKIGTLAVEFLIGRIESIRADNVERVDIPFHLIVRESTASCAK